MQSRREFIKKSFVGGIGLSLIPHQLFSEIFNSEKLLIDPLRFHNKILTIDSHCDTPLNLFDEHFDILVSENYLNGLPSERVFHGGKEAGFRHGKF